MSAASHHLGHRLVRRRHHLGEAHLRADLPPREGRRPCRSRATPSTATTARRWAPAGGGPRRATSNFSHFGPETNLLEELERCSRVRRDRHRADAHYVHDDEEAERYGAAPGTFTAWEPFEDGTDLLFYEGLHGAVVTDEVNLARTPDLKIGVVPVINLEWIQKIHRDKATRGYSTEAVTDVILRRMHGLRALHLPAVHRRPTSTSSACRWSTPRTRSSPAGSRRRTRSMVVIRFGNPRGIDFPYLLSMIHEAFMSRANSIVIPGDKLDLAMQLILTPLILQLIERKRGARPEGAHRSRVQIAMPPPSMTATMANAIRALAMDAVEQAKSGHPGMPMGMADVATVLFTRFLKLDPPSPDWPDRDRFVLSAGHGSMLLYALLHLTGYADMPMDELKRFRQLGSRTPGHPEYGHARRRDDDRAARPGDRQRRSAWRSPSGCWPRASATSSSTTSPT